MLDVLVNLLISANNDDDAKRFLSLLEEQSGAPLDILEKLRISAGNSLIILADDNLQKRINSMLKKHGIEKDMEAPDLSFSDFTDEIPF